MCPGDVVTYSAITPGSFTWRVVRAITGVVVRPRTAARDTRRRPRDQIIDDGIRGSFGATPDLEARKDHLYLMMYGGVIGAFAVGAIGIAVGAVVQATVDQGVGTGVMKTIGVLGGAPLLALGLVWAARAQFNDIDYRRWTKQGRPAGHVPSSRSQPKDRDLLYALPLALLFALFFWAA